MIACLASGLASRAAEPSTNSSKSILQLANGGYVAGELADSDGPGRIGWRSPLFSAPFDFDLAAVNTLNFALPAKLPKPVGDYCFELSHGDVLFGSLAGWKAGNLELDIPRIGRIHVREAELHRIYRWRSSTDLVYLGPNGLAGWQASTAGKGWREDSGRLATDQDGAFLSGDFELPDRAIVEFEISWKKRPDFVFSLGIGESKTAMQQAWRFEVWDGDLVVRSETEDKVDLAAVQKIEAGPGRTHLFVYLDGAAGRCLVLSPAGQTLAELKLDVGDSQAPTGVRLENKRGDLSLDRLRIARWAGQLPREFQADKPRIHRADGSILYGEPAGFDAAAQEFIVREKQGEKRVPASQVESVVLSLPEAAAPRAVRIVYQNGAQLSGDLVKVAEGSLWLRAAGSKEPLRLSAEGLRSIVVMKRSSSAAEESGLYGTLNLDGVRLRGQLVDGVEEPGASCLVWQPLGSAKGTPLRPGVSGNIVYREPPPPAPRTAQAAAGVGVRIRVLNQNGAIIQQMVPPAAMPPGMGGPPAIGARVVQQRVERTGKVFRDNAGNSQATSSRMLHLRSGDCVPCELKAIDENGITIWTSMSDATFVPHDKIKAVELVHESANAMRLNKVKRDRLLTLPRMQKDSPPTHLIHSRSGDFLRGRIISLDDKNLRVEVRLETKEIPRDRVAQIIWLHADELEDSGTSTSDELKPSDERASKGLTPAEEKIRRTLEAPTTIEFLDLPLEDCIQFLQEYHNINVQIDKQALADEGVALDSPITLKLAGVRFRSILRLLLEPVQLAYVIEDDVLKITTAAKAGEKPDAQVIPVPRPAPPAARQPADSATRVLAVRSDGIRLTFVAEQMAEASLSGTSEVLGACRVSLKEIDQLLIGGAIEEAAARLAYQQWRLHHAQEPKFVLDDGDSDDGGSGTDSPLVGKAAPDFELALLDGKKFRLAAFKGKVVVLDFWATWCGPCLTAMPLVEAAAREFADQGVQLIAVNQEETPKQIHSMLERHKLDLTVALDRDGAVSGRYRAVDIPQTVVIDREGNVARVFVGGGPRAGERIREALRAILNPDHPAEPPTE